MDLGLAGRVALVCGSTKGLGRAVAKALAHEGARVAINGRHADSVEHAAQQLSSESAQAVMPFVADVGDPAQAEGLVERVHHQMGRLDVLFCNASGPPAAPFTQQPAEAFHRAVELNLLSTVHLARAAVPIMRKLEWGRIICLASVAAKQPLPGLILSTTARAGVLGFAKALADEVAAEGITVNVVCPGFIATERITELTETRAKREQRASQDGMRELVVGHEFAGEIVATGDGVSELRAGQLVTAEGHIVCGRCLQCRTGNSHICKNTRIIGVDRDGAFAEYIAMPATNVLPLDGVPTTVGAIMDPMGNAFHAVLSAEIQGSSVFVVGCGPIGCFAVGIARAAGAAKVIASDVNAKRLELARRMGAHVTIDATTDDVVRAVLAETAGEGADVVCEMSGVPSALHQAFAAVRLGGRVQLLGIPKGEVPIDFASEIIFKGITVYGVIGRKMYDTWHQMRRYLTAGLLDPRPVITHQFPLAKIDEALAAIRAGDAGKIILEIA